MQSQTDRFGDDHDIFKILSRANGLAQRQSTSSGTLK